MNNLLPFGEIGVSSIQGPRHDMQDVYAIHHLRRNRYGVGGRIHVFDGHGHEGAAAAQVASSVFTVHLNQPIEELKNVFFQADAEILRASIDGGTTATVVDINIDQTGTRTISTLWAGDSPAYLAWPDLDFIGDRNTIYTCTDALHNVDNHAEVERMRNAGVHTSTRYFGNIAISRSLGDSGRYPGVIPDPEATEFQSKNNRLLIVGSDGVLDSEDTIDVIGDVLRLQYTGTLQKAAEHIAYKYSLKNNDNATIILADLPRLF